MHPASSVIIFTTFSGTGYGLMMVLLATMLLGWLPRDPSLVLYGLLLSFALVTIGLLSSTLHLGHPERAWRAISQWRSSWLSREGLMALITYVPMGVLIITAFMNLPDNEVLGTVENAVTSVAATMGEGHMVSQLHDTWVSVMMVLGVICAGLTVFTTAMIYRSLKPVAHWHNGFVVPLYLLMSLMAGSMITVFFMVGFGYDLSYVGVSSMALIFATFGLKLNYWRAMNRMEPTSTMESATGLGHLGKVSVLEQAHTEDNYLMKEMGYQVARKHADKLKFYYRLFAFICFLTITAISIWQFNQWWVMAISALSLIISLLVERWLFFAEAKHAVALYYGKK